MPDKTVRALSIYVYPDNEIEDARLGRERRGPPTVMFVAGFRHRPNVDAALWFVREVLPLVRLRIPKLHTILAGSFPPPAVTGLANERVLVTDLLAFGWVSLHVHRRPQNPSELRRLPQA